MPEPSKPTKKESSPEKKRKKKLDYDQLDDKSILILYKLSR
jgi:hypothetical protein